MSGPLDFTYQDIEQTYQRVLQTDGTWVYNGTGSLIDTISFPNLNVSGNLYVSGTLFASNTITVTQSYYSGSQIFGDQLTDTHRFTGSIFSTGSNFFTGSNSFNGNVTIRGNLTTTGSFFLSGSSFLRGNVTITGSLSLFSTSSNIFIIRNQSNTPVLTVSQSGILILSTQSTELTGEAPNGAIYFTADSMYIGLD